MNPRAPRSWKHLSIRTKLIGVTAILIASIIGFLTWYFPSREIKALATAERTHVTTYGELLASELRSAVAFGDRATAEEVLSSLAVDPDLASIRLYGADGSVLYEAGTPSPWVDQAKSGVIARRLVEHQARIAVVNPVISLEGPRGTLVIELSTERSRTEQATIFWTALAIGVVLLAFGVVVAWAIGRKVARRLRNIGRVATAVASNAETHEHVIDDMQDEIGVLATGFNVMLDQLAADRVRLKTMVTNLRTAEEALEQRVEQRTAQLREAMNHRAEMEIELRQAQKLESVGRLAAGIAHEINSPIQFVSDSCAFLDDASKTMSQIVAARRAAIATALTREELATRLGEIDTEFDVDGLLENFPTATKLALQGLERVAGIVRAMKEFAYADHTEQAAADLNRAIQNTLLVARNEYKYVADICTHLGELPNVMCHVGEINQVVLNIIVNAAHAIETAVEGKDERGCITIRTSVDGSDALIEIQDDGCGIPAAIIEKIYDPFFTTKEIGKGSGQGLAIARSVVVEKHHGKLDVASIPNVGTTFTIRLPIAGFEPEARAIAA